MPLHYHFPGLAPAKDWVPVVIPMYGYWRYWRHPIPMKTQDGVPAQDLTNNEEEEKERKRRYRINLYGKNAVRL